MLKANAGRTDFATRLQEIIDRYNAGSSSADNYFNDLMAFAKDLKKESERHIREGLSEDELELFDLIKKDKMTKEETQKVQAGCAGVAPSSAQGAAEGAGSRLVQRLAVERASQVGYGECLK